MDVKTVILLNQIPVIILNSDLFYLQKKQKTRLVKGNVTVFILCYSYRRPSGFCQPPESLLSHWAICLRCCILNLVKQSLFSSNPAQTIYSHIDVLMWCTPYTIVRLPRCNSCFNYFDVNTEVATSMQAAVKTSAWCRGPKRNNLSPSTVHRLRYVNYGNAIPPKFLADRSKGRAYVTVLRPLVSVCLSVVCGVMYCG